MAAQQHVAHGYFFDDDDDPDTDALLMAWYGSYDPQEDNQGELTWRYGAAGQFAAVPDEIIEGWEADPDELYSVGVIDDLVNVGLNYIVTIGDTTSFDKFTIRITPSLSSNQEVPDFVVPSLLPVCRVLPVTFS